jgi:hypothetical protein
LLSKNKINITTIVAIHLALLQQFSGINAVGLYGGEIAGQALPDLAFYLPSFINMEQVLAVLVTSYLLSKFGRKTLLQFGAIGSAFSNGLIAIGFFVMDSSP